MTTLYIRYPAKASMVASNAAPAAPFALVGDGGNLLQQGAAALGSMADVVRMARRVVLLLAASDVTLLQVKVPPLSAARLKAALPNLVEEQLLGDLADCVLAAGPAQGADGLRAVAVVQRGWLEVLVKALVAQGAHSVAAVPAQLCLPYQPGCVSAALSAGDNGLELTLRQSQYQGLGLALGADPAAALQTVRALAGDEAVNLYLPAGHGAQYEQLAADFPGLTLLDDHWTHWVAAVKVAGIDLAAGLGASGASARRLQRWRWPLRLAVAALVLNIAAVNVQWLRLKREATSVRQSMLQIYKAVYPNDPIQDTVAQMRLHLGEARINSGQVSPDEFTALCAAFGEALAALPNKDIIAALEYRDHGLLVKVKPNTVDAAAVGQLKSALAVRKLELSESQPGTWHIHVATGGSKS